MSNYLLDTTFLIDLERGAVSAYDELLGAEEDVAIAALTVAELMLGVELASPIHRGTRQARVDSVLRSIPVIDYDLRVAAAHAALLAEVRRTGRPRQAHDLIVAATARSSGRTVVSADVAAFADLSGVEVLSYGR